MTDITNLFHSAVSHSIPNLEEKQYDPCVYRNRLWKNKNGTLCTMKQEK